MRAVALLTLLLAAAPVCAELAQPTEARAALGSLKDRLRIMYERNGKRVDANWRVEDLLPVQDLRGSYFTETDYSLTFDPKRAAWARLQCVGGGYYRGPLAVEIDLTTGASRWIEPGPSEVEIWEERLLAIKVFLALLAGPVLLTPILFRKRLRADFRVGLWMFGAGASSLMVHAIAAAFFHLFNTEHTPEPARSIAGFGLLIAAGMVAVGFGMFIIGTMFRTKTQRAE